MKNPFNVKKIVLLCLATGCTMPTFAASFQIWNQDAASVGNYHAGRAAIADDASTNFYNPAGLVRIHNQQLLVGGTPTTSDVRFRGTIATNTSGTGPEAVSAQGGTFNFLPYAHYAAPLDDKLVFGLSVMTPYNSYTNYGLTTNAQYAATQSSIRVIDVSPSLGFAYNDKIAVGLGMDIEHARGEFDYSITSAAPGTNSLTKNTGTSYGYGFHAGALYTPSENTRIGLNFLSQVKHHLHGGNSNLSGPLANGGTGGTQYTNGLKINVTLPATTTLSAFHTFNQTWDMMGTIIYSQWNVFQQLLLQNVSGITGGATNNLLIVTMPQNYRNSWNYALGGNYHINEKWFVRAGVGFDETPSNNTYRNLQFPDSNQIALALGAHIQATSTLGVDIGWTHSFAQNTRINNLSQPLGDQVTTTNGSINTSTDVYGLGIKWDII